METFRHAANLLGFFLGYAACVWGAAQGRPMLGPLVVAVLLVIRSFRMTDPARQIGLVATVAIVGTLLDSTLAATGLLQFDEALPERWLVPLWVTALWLNLGLALQGLPTLAGRYLQATAVGVLAGPLWYATAVQAGALLVFWQPAPALALFAALGAVWAPLLVGLGQLPPYRPRR